jgi:hypothetical protein
LHVLLLLAASSLQEVYVAIVLKSMTRRSAGGSGFRASCLTTIGLEPWDTLLFSDAARLDLEILAGVCQ